MKEQILLIIATIAMFGMGGCGKENVDLSPPTMEVNSYVPTPMADDICGTEEPVVFHLTGGDQLTFDVVFIDDISLSQYKVDIHNNFDCHGHGGGNIKLNVVPDVDNVTTDWSLLDIQDISGTNEAVVRTLNVPENVTTGNYHFQIQVLDEAGNDNPAANFFALKVSNPLDNTSPELTIQEPAINNFSIKKGEAIRFTGQVTDDRSLSDGGNGVLYLAFIDLSSGNTFATDEVFAFDNSIVESYDFDFEYTVPQTLVAGDYQFILGAHDGVRNQADFQVFEVEITN